MVGEYMLRKKFFIPKDEYCRKYGRVSRKPDVTNFIVNSEWTVDTDDAAYVTSEQE